MIGDAVEVLSRRIEDRLVTDGTPGIVVSITDRDRTLHVDAHGLAGLSPTSPMRIDHLLEIGSIGKSFAAIVALQLRDEGLLGLDDPITDYLPWFVVQDVQGAITTRHLLTHTAGLTSGSMGYYDARAEVWALRRTKVGAPPGSFFHYSNDGYQAVGLILTAVTGRPYHELLRERVLSPLGMTSSHPNFTNDVRSRLAVGHVPAADDRPYVPGRSPLASATWFVGDTADGSICATAEDMARYLRLWLSRGGGAYGDVLTRDGFDEMTTPALPIEDGDGYGFGVGVGSVDGRTRLLHGGGMVGYVAQVVADVANGLGVVVLANGPAEVEEIANEAMDLVIAAKFGAAAPVLRDLRDRERPGHADGVVCEYLVGEYQGPEGLVVVEVSGAGLRVTIDGVNLAMFRLAREDLLFAVDHPELGLAPLLFTRNGDGISLAHGRRWYAGLGYRGAVVHDPPPGSHRLAGLYRAHNPWRSCVRFVVQRDALVMVDPGSGIHERLLPDDGATTFRFAADDRLPDRVRFHSFIDGVPSSVEVEGFDYFRSADPPSCWNVGRE